MAKVVYGSFSKQAGSAVRVMRDPYGRILGTITKTDGGYRIVRVDGKVRVKKSLEDAFKSISRAN